MPSMKSAAYEEGLRQGAAMAAGSKKGDENQGTPPESSPENVSKGPMKKGVARDGNKMKKPMDGEPCNCGKGKGLCDGSCKQENDAEYGCSGTCGSNGKACKTKKMSDGDCSMKPQRSDSLTAREYFTACELGIEDRPKAYIRARLDAVSKGKKCGGGWTSQQNQCRQGPGAQASKPNRGSQGRKNLESAAITAGSVGSIVSNTLGVYNLVKGNVKAAGRSFGAAGAFNALEGAGTIARGRRTGSNYLQEVGSRKVTRGLVGAAIGTYASGDLSRVANSVRSGGMRQQARRVGQNLMGNMSAKKANFTMKKKKQQVWRGYTRSLLDGVYADGFKPNFDQLAV
jgi:hypothetical protein